MDPVPKMASTMTWTLASLLLASSLLPGLQAAGQETEPRQDAGPSAPSAPPSRLGSLRQALRAYDMPLVRREADAIRASAPRGSEEWLEASAALARAHHDLWDPMRLEAVAREVLREAAELRAGTDSTEIRSALGPLSPFSAARVLDTQILLARLLQSRGLHHEALGHLRAVLDDVQSGPVDDPNRLSVGAGLDAAWSHRALGRTPEARSILQSLRDRFPDTREGMIATVVLENDLGAGTYAGRYAGDAAQLRRIEALWAARASAGRRVAAALGIDPATLPHVLVGVADRPAWIQGSGGFTTVDPRRPAIPAVSVLYSQMLALGAIQPEQVLVHELAHAVPARRWGLRYEALPAWLAEALATALAGELGSNLDGLVTDGLVADYLAFVREDYWERHPPNFDSPSPSAEQTVAVSLLGLLLVDTPEPKGLKRFLAEMEAGKSGEEALREACGLSFEEYRHQAAAHAFERMRAARAEALPAVARIAKESEKGAAEALAVADRVLAEGGPRIARAFARIGRAEALEELERAEEAVAAWQAVLDALPESPGFALMGRQGRVRALILAGKLDEASTALAEVRRGATDRGTFDWAVAMEQDLARQRAPR